MPDYKKKKIHKIKGLKKTLKLSPSERFTLEMSSQKTDKAKNSLPRKNMKVVKGKKLERRRKLRILLVSLLAFFGVVATLSFILPCGLYENIVNTISIMGNGGYPIEIYGTEALDTVSKGSYYYLLTDSRLSAFSNNGKEIYSYVHGFENPVLSSSDTRALLFNQGSDTAEVYNLNKKICTITTEMPIITASITRSGRFAIATYSDAYTSSVNVYDKNGRQIFVWNSANDTINNVCLSPNGKKLAVSVLNATGGQLYSKVMIFEFDSANPVHSYNLSSDIIISLENIGKYLWAVTSSGAIDITWSDYQHTDISAELELYMFRKSSSEILMVFNRASDKSDNRIMLFSASGEKISEFTFDGLISDIQYAHGHIYCISETNASLFDKNGKLFRSAICDYGAKRLAVTGSHSLVTITDSNIKKLDLEETE